MGLVFIEGAKSSKPVKILMKRYLTLRNVTQRLNIAVK